jgi:hypothetical protein
MKIEFDKSALDKALKTLESFTGKTGKSMVENAFNRALFDTRKRIQSDMRSIFKSKNDYTVNSVVVRQLKFTDQLQFVGGSIEFKKKERGSGVGAGIYLMPEEWGGTRMLKGFELRLQKMGLIDAGVFAVPTTNYPLNKRNPSSLQRLATDLGKSVSRVYAKKKKTDKAFDNYFVLKRSDGHLKPGIYMRNGRKVVMLFAYLDRVSYRQIFGFYDKCKRYFAELFPVKLDDEINKRLAGEVASLLKG